jgi:hypothetical protein
MKGQPSFSNLTDILLYPWEDIDLIGLITFSVSLVVKDFSVVFGRGFLKVCDKNE